MSTMAKYEEKITLELETEDVEFDEIEPEDYVFIVKADGTLKSVLFPEEEQFEYSEELMRVFNVFDVDDPAELTGNHTIH
jgi:hypothetical protein